MRSNRHAKITIYAALIFLVATTATVAKERGEIIHDAEHNILKTQHGDHLAKEDAEIDAKLAEIRKKNGGKPPNTRRGGSFWSPPSISMPVNRSSGI